MHCFMLDFSRLTNSVLFLYSKIKGLGILLVLLDMCPICFVFFKLT